MKQGIHVIGGNAQNCFVSGDQAFVRHINGDLYSGLRGALSVAGLKHPQLAALDGEFNVLNIFVVLFKFGGNSHELLVSGRHVFDEVLDCIRIADTGDYIFALGIDQILTHHDFIASGWIARKRHAGS